MSLQRLSYVRFFFGTQLVDERKHLNGSVSRIQYSLEDYRNARRDLRCKVCDLRYNDGNGSPAKKLRKNILDFFKNVDFFMKIFQNFEKIGFFKKIPRSLLYHYRNPFVSP